MYHFGFVIEQALGHITHGQNLKNNVACDPDVQAFWALPAFETQGVAAKIPVYRSNWTVRAGWRARRALSAIARQTKLDALFFHTQVTGVLAQDWVQHYPSVVSLDATPRQYDSLGDFYDHAAGPEWLEDYKWRLNRDLFRKARHLVTWSQWAKDGLVSEYEVPPAKVTVIPPGVNVHAWTAPAPHGKGSGPVKILFVGGNLERKGGLVLLEAFRRLRADSNSAHETSPPVELHLVTRDRLEPEPGLFVYNDMQPNSEALKHLYFDSDIFCLPTQGDCLPMVLSEAGAAGLPVVSTRVAAIPEIIHDEVSGFVVPPGDTEALTAALRLLVHTPELRQSQGAAAKRITASYYDAEANARRLLELLKHVAVEGRSAQ